MEMLVVSGGTMGRPRRRRFRHHLRYCHHPHRRSRLGHHRRRRRCRESRVIGRGFTRYSPA